MSQLVSHSVQFSATGPRVHPGVGDGVGAQGEGGRGDGAGQGAGARREWAGAVMLSKAYTGYVVGSAFLFEPTLRKASPFESTQFISATTETKRTIKKHILPCCQGHA